MQRMTSWGTADRKTFITLDLKVLEVFQKHVQQDNSAPESGGILLGHVRGDHLEILEATVPTKWDKRMRHFFERLPFGHQFRANERWATSNGTVRYLGEWHTHPEDLPKPSQLDLVEWSIQAKKRTDKRAMLAIIVGRRGLHLELVSPKGANVLLELVC